MKRFPRFSTFRLLMGALLWLAATNARAQDTVPGTLLSFDGVDDYMIVPDDDALDLTTFTVETWVRMDAVIPDWQPLIIKENQFVTIVERNYGMWIVPNERRIHVSMTEADCITGDASTFDSVGELTLGAWHHVAMTYDGASFNLYIDGVLDGAHPVSITPCQATGPVMFGWGGFVYSPFDGALEEARIWSVARTETEIREGMHRTMTGAEPGLVAYWQFNEGTGTTAADVVGGHDGALVGGAPWESSLVPVGGGVSATATASLGAVDFPGTDLTMNFTANDAADPITVTRLDGAPPVAPGMLFTPFDAQYWVVERFGPGAFDVDVTFTVSEDLTAADEADPGRVKLFRRSATADDETWGVAASASSVDAAANTATFSGLTGFGQFLLGRSGTPDTEAGTLLGFDGVDDRAFARTDLDLGASDVTLEAWVRRTSSGTNDFFFSYGDVNEGVNQGLSMGFRPTNVFAFGFAGGNDLDTPDTYTDTEWHHWAGVYDRANATRVIYRDGVEVASDAGVVPFEEVANPELYLGRFFLQNGSDFGGEIEELRIWSVARTETEIREGMHRTMTGDEPGLVAYWQFNEATGATAADVVGGHDVDLINGTAWAESDVPVAGGVSVTRTEADGTVDFSAAGVTMDYISQSGASVTVTRLDGGPSSLPEGGSVETPFDSRYWIFEREGAGSFDVDVTFTVSEDLTNDVAGRLLLFRRDSRAGSDAPWEQVGAADSLDAAAGTVTFRGLTAFSQFIIVRAPAAQPVPGTLLDFDGVDDYVIVPDDDALDLTTFTVETWVRMDAVIPDWQPLIVKENQFASIAERNYGMWIVPNAQRVHYSMTGADCAVASGIGFESAGELTPGAWHHVAMTYDGASFNLYIDGVLDSAHPMSITPCQGTGPVMFGWGGSVYSPFDGALEEARIWSVARTETEIREGMHRTMTGAEPGLVAYWQLNEGSGVTAFDIVGGNDGTLTNMDAAAWVASDVPVGGGVSATATAAPGTVDFSAAGVTMDFVTNETGDPITVTRLDLDPFDAPSGAELAFLGGRYWVVERFGDGAFEASLTFTLDDLTAEDAADPGRLKLLRRDSRARGGTWSVVAHGVSVDDGAGTVTFDGLTGFSQFAVARGGTPGTLAGNAASFGGFDYVDLGDLGDFGRRLEHATTSFWMKSTTTASGAILKVEVDPDVPTSPIFAVEANRILSTGCTVGDEPGATTFYLRDNAGKALARYVTEDLYDGAWHHVVWVIEDATANAMTVYVDGVPATLEGSCSQSPATFVDWGASLFAGAANEGGTAADAVAVSLDELRLFDVSRTAEEVRASAHRPLDGDETGLIAYWQFDEADGDPTAVDVVGGHDGTFVNGAATRIASTIPLGAGVFAFEVETGGTLVFGATGLTAEYFSHSASGVGVTRIDRAPTNPPVGSSIALLDSTYRVMERYDGGPFSADLTFATGGLTTDDEADPSRIKLFRRDANEDGEWLVAATATAVDAAAGTAVFPDVSNSGQFVLARGASAPAVAGSALDFDGTDDFVKLTGLVLPNTFTVEMWIDPQSGTDGRAFFSKDVDDGSGFLSTDVFNVGFYDGRLRVYLRGETVDAGERVTGQQHLAVVVKETGGSSVVTVYRNGVVIAEETLAALLDDDGRGPDWTLGQNWVEVGLAKAQADPPADDFFDGAMDEVRIWNEARTEAEIRATMHHVFDGTVDGLLGYWPLNEGAGLVAADLVAGHDGALEGGTAWLDSGAPIGDAVTAERAEDDGVVEFSGADLQIDYAAQDGADVYATRIDGAPNQTPPGVTEVFDGQYWVLERFGAGAFTADVTFTPSEALDDLDALLAGRIKLYRRAGAADGAWTPVAEAAGVNPFTGTVTFRHLSEPGQYLLARSDAAALALDGVDDYASTENTDPLDSWTLEAWVKGDAAPSDTLTSAIVARGTNYAIFWDHPDATARGAAALTVGGVRYTAGFGTLEAGRWYHLAASYDGETLRAYRNGKLVTENEDPSGAPDDDGALLEIGRDAATGGLFSGMIDEVRLWNLFRTGDKILADMQHTLAGDETGMAGYWRFDLLVSGGVRDLSDGGHDAALHGDAVLVASDVPADLVFPGAVTASDAVYEDRVEIAWDPVEVEEATIAVLRDGVQISVAAGDVTSFSDTEGLRGVTFEYCLVLSAPLRGDSDPVCDDGSRILFAPDAVAATDSTLADGVTVSWTDRSAFETAYNVYRDDAFLAALDPDAQSYSDTTAVPGTAYTYCVEAEDEAGVSSEQRCDVGSRGFVLPPLDVAATDGQYPDRVVLTWADQAADETGYRILRDDAELATVAADVVTYEDLAPVSGVTHTYCVVTLKDALESLPVCDTGGIDILPVPGDFSATLDAFDDRVELAWTDPVDFEDGFLVYRRDLAEADSTLLTTTDAGAESYTDSDAVPGVDYRYCVATLSSVSGSDVVSEAACAMGRRSLVLAPTDVAATDDEHEDHVVLTWNNPATRAVLMNLYRIDADTTLIKTITSSLTTYSDYEQASGVTYTYCVAAVNEDADESAWVCDEGSRSLNAPTSVAAGDAVSEDFVEVTWVDNSEIEQGYRVYRQAASESFPSLVGETGASQVSFQDFTGVSGVTYTYSVVAFDAYSESEPGLDEGFRALAAPTDVAAADGAFEDRIEVTWRDNSRAEDGYRIYRRTLAAEDSVLVGTTDKNLGSFEDATVELGETYLYSVVAFDDFGASASASDEGTTVIFAPETFNASDAYPDRVVLSWIDRSEVEEGYQVLRDDVLIATTPAGGTAYIDSTAVPGVTYTYCARAFGGVAFSEKSCDAGAAVSGDGIVITGANAVAASDGAFDTRVQITWSTASVDGSQGFNVTRDGVSIDVTGADVSTYNDFDAAPGTLALYCVASVATGLEVGCDYGWTPPDGSISGRVASQLGGGIGDVEVCLDPNPNKALLFDGEGGYTSVQEVTLPDVFTVELWVRPSDLDGEQDLIVLPAAGVRLGFSGSKVRATLGADVIESADGIVTTGWQHLALVIEQDRNAGTSAVQFFRDGVALVASATVGAVLPNTPQPWLFGGDTVNAAYFGGRMDEARLWSRALTTEEIAASASEALPLSGDEDDLLGYWPMDQGEGRIAGDRSGGNAHAAFVGGVYWTEESAPLKACATTDAEGNYTVSNLRYGSGTTFTVTPSLGVRQFDPTFKTITLSANSPVQNEVDFTDVSAFTIAGVVQYEGAACPVPNAEVYVDDVFKGTTETDGSYAVAADVGERLVEVRLGSAGDEHPFTPASTTVTVADDVFGVDFTDGKTRTLSGFFGGSCNTAIGTATIKIFTADGCFEKIIETDANYEVELPPQKYLVQVTNVETTNAALKADIIEFFDNLGAQEVDLTEAADTLDLIYHAPLAVTISGFPEPPAACAAGFNDGGLPAVPVLAQGMEYPLTISVVEDFGDGQTCPLEDGTLTVTDGIGNESVVATLELVDGEASYTTTAGEPDIFSGRTIDGVNRSFQRSLNVVAEVDGRAPVDETAWAIIEGAKARTATFVSATTGEIPLLILHDPPGSNSYSYLAKGTTTCNSVSHMKLTGGDAGVEFDLVLGFKSANGLGVSIESGAGLAVRGRFVGGQDVTELDDGERSLEICATTTERFATSSDMTWVGEDLFVGVAFNLIFAEADVLSVDAAACSVDLSEALATDFDEIEPFKTVYVYGKSHIELSLIPELEDLIELVGEDASIDISSAVGVNPLLDVSVETKQLLLTEALANWQGMLDQNEANKAEALEAPSVNRSLSGGAEFEYAIETVETETKFAQTTRIFFESTGGIGAVLTGAGYDQTGLAVFDARSESVKDTLATEADSELMGYVLSDGDTGDFFSIDVGTDPVYGTPVFGTVSGRSSNPWEANTQKRDNPRIEISPPILTGVDPDEPASFNLTLINASESKETRQYSILVPGETNPKNLGLTVTGDLLGGERLETFTLEPDEALTITMDALRTSTAYTYDSVGVMIYPPTEYDIWKADTRQPFALSDTAFFSVHFASPCSEIAILRPKENWIYNADMAEAGDSVEVILNDFTLQEADVDPVESIGLEYRPVDTPDWLPALEVQASTLDPGADSYVAKWKPPADGLFEVRAFTSCPLGTTYSEPFPGVADTKRPEPFGTPQPADEALALGDDIAVTFDEDIDCATVSADGQFPDATLTYLDGADAGATIPVEASCDGRTIILDPLSDDADLEGRLLEARLLSGVVDGQGVPVVVSDLVGNGIGEDVAWTFTVRQSAFTFSPVNLDLEITRGTGAVAATSLVNGRAQPITFALPPTFDLTHEDGVTTVTLTPSVTAGTIVPGGAKTIQFTLPDTLALGAYEGTLLASGTDADGVDLGQTPFTLTADVVCEPPEWRVTPSNFQYSMTLTAQLFFDGVASADTSDVLAAFVGDEVRGVGTVSEGSPGVFRVDMLIYGNVLSGEVVTFKAWQHAACTLHEETSKTFVFESGAVQGTFAQPVTIEAPPPVQEQAVALAAGWTWFSLNAAPDDASVNAVLADVAGAEGDIVKSQTAFSLFDDDFGWVGTLPAIEPGPAYLINLRQSNSLSVSGTVVDPPSLPITLTPGWNWIGYLPQASLPINEALASLDATAVADDLIKSQFAFAQYVDGLGWVGSLTTMDPGLGYQINVANGGTLTYPANTEAAASVARAALSPNPEAAETRPLPKTRGLAEKEVRPDEGAPEMRETLERAEAKNDDAGAGPGWTVDPLAYPFSMTLTARVERDGKPMRRPNLRVGLFAGDELRGVGRITYVEALRRSLVFALAYGEEETDLTVRVFDDADGQVYDAGTIRFRPGAAAGSPLEPVRIAAKTVASEAAGLPETFALEPAYPNPFNPVTTIRYALPQAERVTLEVFDMLGRRVATLVNEAQKAGRYALRFEAGDLASGVYFYRMRAGSFVETHKMVLLK